MGRIERIVVTGLGALSPIGNNVEELWHALVTRDSKPESREGHGFDASTLNNRLCYSVSREDSPVIEDGATTALAVAAAREAIADAQFSDLSALTVGVGVGTGAGDSDIAEAARFTNFSEDYVTAQQALPYGVAERVADEFCCNGPAFTLSNACSASLYACAHAAELLRVGAADAFLVVGAETVGRVTQASMERMFALDAQYCRPFDALRSGTMLGEGAVALVLELESRARARGAHIHGELKGYATNCDAYHPTAPLQDGAAAEVAVREALQRARLGPEAIDLIIPHGTGTPLNDRIEGAVLRRVFGNSLDAIPVCPIKAKLGHGGGSAGAFSLLAALLIMRAGVVPPIFNRRSFVPDCDLRFVWGEAEDHPVSHALVNAYAFGGNNISLVVGSIAPVPSLEKAL